MAGLLFAALFALLLGYSIGARRSQYSRRELQRDLGARSIDLLEARADVTRLEEQLAAQPRHQRVARLALTRLADTKRLAEQRFIAESRARLAAAEADARARRAARLARAAAARVKELEDSATATGTIRACAPKSYGNADPVTVSVVDHETAEARRDATARVNHQDRARLATLASSNESHRAVACAEQPMVSGLRLIEGLVADDEDRLNALGIHDLEQLAELTEPEQLALRHLIDTLSGPRPLGAWIGTARALLGSESPA